METRPSKKWYFITFRTALDKLKKRAKELLKKTKEKTKNDAKRV